MTVTITDTFSPAPWEAVVSACRGNPLHLPAVHRPAYDAGALRFLVFRDGEETAACALGLATVPRLARLRRRGAELLLPTPPAALRDTPAVMESLIDAVRGAGYRRLVVGTSAGRSYLDAPGLAPHVTTRIVEFVLDLRREPEEILSAMHKVHRKNVRRAERAGITVAAEPTLDALLALRSMQEVAAERSRQKGGGFRVQPAAYFEKLHRHVFSPGIGELWVARREGSIVAALAYLGTGETAMTVRSGSTPDGYETRAMYRLQAAVIDRARERGFTKLNLGGVPEAAAEDGHPEHGLYDFKKGFGAQAHLRTGLALDL